MSDHAYEAFENLAKKYLALKKVMDEVRDYLDWLDDDDNLGVTTTSQVVRDIRSMIGDGKND